jgi:UDP-glucose 4-epimerase
VKVLVTGGAGYIGSHTCVELLEAGHDLIVADNFSNSKKEVIDCLYNLTGKKFPVEVTELCSMDEAELLFKKYKPDAVIHFAGFKAVGESVSMPLKYFRNNLISFMNVLRCMEKYSAKKLVFSSSATVYGTPKNVPVTEDAPLDAVNPYGRTKLMIEDMIRDVYESDPSFGFAILRYFNPVGAHPSGLIGEVPNGTPNNLMPYITGVASGRYDILEVYGSDYPTPDGTGIRDYIHITDLAKGHAAALDKIASGKGLFTYNLGTGRGYSVLEVIDTFERVTGQKVPYRIERRRPGDVAESFADPSRAENEMGWKARLGIDEMCRDAWNFTEKNPDGYKKPRQQNGR